MTGLRVSDFAVFAPAVDGTALALNTCFGTAVEVPEAAAGQLAAGDLAGLPPRLLASLVGASIVTARPPEEERLAFSGELLRRGRVARASPPRVYLMPSYDCNLKCVYCFQHGIRRTTPSVTMSETVAGKALDYAEAVFGDERRRSVTLYGGEALSPDNRAVVEFLCGSARERGIRLMASTHAWNLDLYEDLLGPAGIEGLHVTVDGPASTHDRLRIGPKGARTYGTIMEHVRLALARGARVRMRVNVDRNVLDKLGELRDHLDADGLLANPLFSAYLAPMFDTRAHVGAGSTVLSRSLVGEDALAARLGGSTRLAAAFCGHPPVYDRIAAAVHGEPPLPVAGHCCHGSRTVVLDPRGDVYPCVFLAGETGFAQGSYLGEEPAPDGSGAWVDDGTRRCRDEGCRFALYCGAGSPYDSFARTGGTRDRSCDCAEFERTFVGYAAAAYRRRVAEEAQRPGA
ncbi:radical SAM protein [Phytohabitans suffuscus]|uniref:Radical SAM/SPASM domain-containing protein n=1 Tax=Phytohabitans suffuscus TaxID=624315 RepID=A0A6F8YWI6_9ACTN|nr:radical SAM protein [Phytohabitans suffuscus]BCB90363.1 radical SAM/SPASM domain-containing protein [Phytohabitans suffuscus]